MKINSFHSSGYADGREHLDDELLKLDLLIHKQIQRLRSRNKQEEPKVDQSLTGFYISEGEVNGMIGKTKQDPGIPGNTRLEHSLQSIKERIAKGVHCSFGNGVWLPFYHLARVFQLNPMEMDILLVCLAPERDLKYERLYAYLHSNVTKKSPSIDLIMDLLCQTPQERNSARTCFSPHSPLFRYDLICFIDESLEQPLIARCVKAEQRVVDFLLHHPAPAPVSELPGLVTVVTPTRDWSTVLAHSERKDSLNRLTDEIFQTGKRRGFVFYFRGPYGAGKKLTAEAFCRQHRLTLLIVDTNVLLSASQGIGTEKIVNRLFRETVLLPTVIYMDHFDVLLGEEPKNDFYRKVIAGAMKKYPFITFLSGESIWISRPEFKFCGFLEMTFPVPSYPVRKRMWEKVLAPKNGIELTGDKKTDRLADTFRLTCGQIRDAANDARVLALSSDKGGGSMGTDELFQACRAQSNTRLCRMGRKIDPKYTLSDIVLPREEKQQLNEILNHVKYRRVIYHDWGFDRKLALGKGLNILFSGSSGTGKTMAVDVIANELQLDYYKIDLSRVVSKYIGETEKNLSAIFNEAETASGILFFDEADALFGKRSEVKDSHDRYANIETGYLLQKMEEFEGVVILATNMKKNMDEAFVRRMHFALDFPFPGEESRLRIWQGIFPREAPLDKNIDMEFLSKRFKVTGGNIKNIALSAAFFAAGENGAVTMEHILRSCKREFQKMGKSFVKTDFGKYYDVLQRLES